jgi:hypothetical protein
MNTAQHTQTGSRWIIWWIVAFLAYPPAGALATALVGGLNNPLQGALGGAIVGLVVGAAQMLALRGRLNMNYVWIIATAIGMALGVGISTALVGADSTLSATLLRAPLAGLLVGIAQAWVLRQHTRLALLWVIALTLLFLLAWYVTAQVITTNLGIGFIIFGASGALVFQVLSGAVLWGLLRAAPTANA